MIIDQIEAYLSTPLFTLNEVIRYTFIFGVYFAIMNAIMNTIRIKTYSNADIPFWWPISIFTPRIPDVFLNYSFIPNHVISVFSHYTLSPIHVLIALCYLVSLILIAKYADKIQTPHFIYLVGFCTIFIGNLIQGGYNGFYVPTSGGSIQYYHDAINVKNALTFIGDYNTIQPELLCHARTHPPGAVLIYYILNTMLANPILISIVMMGISLLSVIYIHKLALMFFSQKTARSITLLFIFLPAVQIYFLSSLDSIILLTFVAIIYYYYRIKTQLAWKDLAMFAIFIMIGSLLNYLIILPIGLVCLDTFWSKNLKLSALIFAVILFVMGIFFLLNFNYIEGFLMSSKLENPSGLRLLSDTLSYITTRIENISEIFLFFGPLSSVLFYRGLQEFQKNHITRNKKNSLVYESIWGLIILIVLFLAGAFRTGETARCCVYIYPLLLFIVAYYLEQNPLSKKSIQQLILVLGAQSLLMQMFGFYFW